MTLRRFSSRIEEIDKEFLSVILKDVTIFHLTVSSFEACALRQDEKVYSALSQRLKGTYDIFGSLPDTIQDDWIDDEVKLIDAMDEYIHLRKNAENAFTVRYRSSLNPDENRWELCSKVLSRRDIEEKMSEGW